MPFKFLVIQTAFLGDAILATALVEKLHQTYPDASIDFLLRKGNEGLLAAHPFLRQVLVFDKKKKFRSMWSLIWQMRRQQYDLVVNVQRFTSSGLMAVLSGAKEIRGFDKNPLAAGYTRQFPHHIGAEVGPRVHEVERNLSLLEGWTDAEAVPPRLYPPAEAYRAIPEGDYICIAPTSVWFTKQWPEEKWAAFIRSLRPDLTIALLGAPGDRDACTRIQTQAGHPKVLNMAGKLSLLESAAWMERARMNYANDSAPVHLASAVNAPLTAIFCSTIPAFGFTPLSTHSRVLETPELLPCRPCGLHGFRACPQGHFRCAEIPLEALEGKAL